LAILPTSIFYELLMMKIKWEGKKQKPEVIPEDVTSDDKV
jgi:hypothetical protein